MGSQIALPEAKRWIPTESLVSLRRGDGSRRVEPAAQHELAAECLRPAASDAGAAFAPKV